MGGRAGKKKDSGNVEGLEIRTTTIFASPASTTSASNTTGTSSAPKSTGPEHLERNSQHHIGAGSGRHIQSFDTGDASADALADRLNFKVDASMRPQKLNFDSEQLWQFTEVPETNAQARNLVRTGETFYWISTKEYGLHLRLTTENSITQDPKYQRLWDSTVYFGATHIEVAHDNNPAQWWWLEPEGSGTNRQQSEMVGLLADIIRESSTGEYVTRVPWNETWFIRVHCECKADAPALKKPGLWDFQSAGTIADEVSRIN